MPAPLSQNDRFGQTALIVEPMIAASRKFSDGILCEKLSADPLGRTFVRQRLGTVLAKLMDRPRVRIRPRTRLTIDTALLIEIQKPAYATNDTILPIVTFIALVTAASPAATVGGFETVSLDVSSPWVINS